MITLHRTNQPEAVFSEQLAAFVESGRAADGFALDYRHEQAYLPGAPALELLAIVALEKTDAGFRTALSVAKKNDATLRGLNCLRAEWIAMREWCAEHDLAWLELDRPLRLAPVHIPKPWGQEVWYTGIEARGQSEVLDDEGHRLPLPWLLSVCPRHLLGRDSGELILLKILDPLPQPVLGDLYFEMHEEKREVYVVTHVDSQAWPDGTGGIRFGFDQDKRRSCGDDGIFKADYLSAVEAYRAVRVQIDELLDQRRRDAGIALDAPVDPSTLERWLEDLPPDLLKREATLREEMEAFIHVDPLSVGDVVRVPCFTPHSLLHGVRTVEFQTPVYERKILSFAQKVLTQKHWDTAEALEKISLDPPLATDLPVIASTKDLRIEEVAEFTDFRVERLSLEPGCRFPLETGSEYCLLMGIAGKVAVSGSAIAPEQALFIPASAEQIEVVGPAGQNAIVLLARPRS